MEATHLVLHKVRGEPAMDTAVKLEIDEAEHGEEIWINPTSGHRIYPFKMWLLEDLTDKSAVSVFPAMDWMDALKDWPDHYQNTKSPDAGPEIDFSPLINEFRPVFRRRF